MSKLKLVLTYAGIFLALAVLLTAVFNIFLLGGEFLLPNIIFSLNLAGFIIFGMDKSSAVFGKGRVPEAFFYLIALLGASVGLILGIKFFHHKISKKGFMATLSFIVFLQFFAVVFWIISLTQSL